jgi:hypothetical protein
MTATTQRPVVGVFDHRGQAERAMDALRHAGFPADQLGIAGPGEAVHPDTSPTARLEGTAETGAVTGAITGSAAGAVAGALATGLIPGIGPVIAGGLLVGILGGALAGAAAGSFAGPFLNLGFSEPEAQRYAQHFKEGRTVVTVHAGDRAGEAAKVLERLGGHDINTPHTPGVDDTSAAYSP